MGADGLVLAAETAIGKFPVEAVSMIRNLIIESERWTPDTSLAEIIGN
jgi:pyruvate kinase